MDNQACIANFESIPFVDQCDPCRHYYFTRTQKIKVPTGILLVTLHYDLRTCFEGMAKGPYLNTLTLLPGEEMELEIIKKSKYQTELHEQQSVESEFESQFESTTREELHKYREFNFETKLEAGFELFGIGAKTETEISVETHNYEELFKETVQSSSVKVSKKHDITIDIKSELESSFRSLRKVKNPNECHPVLYLMSQLMKKFKTSLHLVKVTWDYIPSNQKAPEILESLKDSYAVIRPGRVLSGDRAREAFKATPLKVSTINTELKTETNRSVLPEGVLLDRVKQPTLDLIKLPDTHIRNLNKGQLLNRINGDKTRANIDKLISSVLERDAFQLREVFSVEHCIRTSDVYTEVKISPCSACATVPTEE